MLEGMSQRLEGVISPKIEIGAYEALWATGINSLKQIRDKLTNERASFVSELILPEIATEFYKQTIERLNKSGVGVFGVRIDGTPDYPEKLHDADYPLVLLYFQGIWDLALTRGISVIGTRKPSNKGKARAKQLVKELVESGYTIFSGLAAGIDTIAHTTALEYNGKTVAVIGTPLSHTYPKENLNLQRELAMNHLVVSQVPVIRYDKNGPEVNRFYFPERNKTMSSLSEATVIVEAAEASGTLTQARAALKQGRKLFILNSCFENSALAWPVKLEQQGAIRVRDTGDIIQTLSKSDSI